MLSQVRISNFALLEEVQLELGSGLSFFTGETGAGKSILIDAICRLLGARTSADDVRAGASKAILEAVFDSEDLSVACRTLLREWDIEVDGELILRREIQASGKSRATINNCSVTLSQLQQVGATLIDIFGQNEHQSLLDDDSQRELYDRAIGIANLVNELGERSARVRKLQQEWKSLQEREQERQRHIDMLQFQIKEIEDAKPSAQEEQELIAKRSLLQNREKIHMLCATLLDELMEQDSNVLGQIDHVGRTLLELQKYDEDIGSFAPKVAEWREDLSELSRKVDSLRRSLEFEEGALDQLEARLDVLERLKKKYGPGLDDVLSYLGKSRESLDRYVHAEERSAELVEQTRSAVREYEKLAEEISGKRNAGRQKFSSRVESELRKVAMEKCGFQVACEPVVAGPSADWGSSDSEIMHAEYPMFGRETVEFEIEPNPGEGFRPLRKIASGGELSRLMLGLKVVTEGKGRDRSLIFDEIDAGIGGRIAHQIGERLKRLADHAQVLCVTHLPQVAAFGDAHYNVTKKTRGNRTVTSVEKLEEPDRILELARMLSGSEITETALRHARELRESVETTG